MDTRKVSRTLTFVDIGKGLVIDLCVSFMGLTVDSLIGAWAKLHKRALGLAG